MGIAGRVAAARAPNRSRLHGALQTGCHAAHEICSREEPCALGRVQCAQLAQEGEEVLDLAGEANRVLEVAGEFGRCVALRAGIDGDRDRERDLPQALGDVRVWCGPNVARDRVDPLREFVGFSPD